MKMLACRKRIPIWIVAACLVCCLQEIHALDHYEEDSDRFPGWKGELDMTSHTEYHDSVGYGELGQEIWRGRVEQVSWTPRALVYHNFLSDAECDHLINLAEGRLKKSTVVDSKTGGSVDSQVRTSSGTFLATHEDEFVARIEKRLAHITMIPEENGEALQILKYINGQKYEPHTDYFHDQVNQDKSKGGQRIATVLMYLSTPDEGGETVFPSAKNKVNGTEWSECALRGLAVKAIRGNALLFYSLKPDGSEDPTSLHGSCPTLKGTKYSATKWIHQMAFNKRRVNGDCEDTNKSCEEWAAWGECEKNSEYMLDACRQSCGKCTPSPSLRAKEDASPSRWGMGRKAINSD